LDERLHALQDANWNVTALVDTGGDAQERYAYSAYGTARVLTASFATRASSSYGTEVLYAGYRYDQVTGLYHIRHRVYQAELGCWVQRDPNDIQKELHLSRYCRNNPIGRIDRRGTSSEDYSTGVRSTNADEASATQKCMNDGWDSLSSSECTYGPNVVFEADFIMYDRNSKPCKSKCDPHIFQRLGAAGACTARLSWPLDCVCANMPDDVYARCVRGCLRCIFDAKDGNAPDLGEHTWCIDECVRRTYSWWYPGGYWRKYQLYQQLDKAIHCCAKRQGTILGPGTDKKPGPGTGQVTGVPVNCDGCGHGPTRPIDCSGY
jgi:RHS repeat-associated protein